MSIAEMTIEEKKELLRYLYLNQSDLVREVLMEINEEIKNDDFHLSQSEKKEIEDIVDAHFDKYDSVFKALA